MLPGFPPIFIGATNMIPPLMGVPNTIVKFGQYTFVATVVAGGFSIAWGIAGLITGSNPVFELIAFYS